MEENKESKLPLTTMFVCPYKDRPECPHVELFSDDNIVFDIASCDLSPVTFMDGTSVCSLQADFNEPSTKNSLRILGNFVKFRKENDDA